MKMKYICDLIYIYDKGSGLIPLSAMSFANLWTYRSEEFSKLVDYIFALCYIFSTVHVINNCGFGFPVKLSRLFNVFQPSLLFLLFCSLVL